MWVIVKEVIKDFVNYGLPMIAIVFSIISLVQANKSNKLQNRVNELEEKNKMYELEAHVKEKENATKACLKCI
ncbi:MAG: hypothetical protein ACRC7V_04935 [Lachnospiraceae bacterium]